MSAGLSNLWRLAAEPDAAVRLVLQGVLERVRLCPADVTRPPPLQLVRVLGLIFWSTGVWLIGVAGLFSEVLGLLDPEVDILLKGDWPGVRRRLADSKSRGLPLDPKLGVNVLRTVGVKVCGSGSFAGELTWIKFENGTIIIKDLVVTIIANSP